MVSGYGPILSLSENEYNIYYVYVTVSDLLRNDDTELIPDLFLGIYVAKYIGNSFMLEKPAH